MVVVDSNCENDRWMTCTAFFTTYFYCATGGSNGWMGGWMAYKECMDTKGGQQQFLWQPNNSKWPCFDDTLPPSLLINREEGRMDE